MLALLLTAAWAAEPLVLLDAGPTGAPVLAGFAALHPGGSDDPRVTWAVPPARAARDDLPDPLAGDHLDGGTLHLDLPPGRYVVHALLGEAVPTGRVYALDRWGLRSGDALVVEVEAPPTWEALADAPLLARVPRPVFLPGASAWDRQVAPIPWVTGAVTVAGDGLALSPVGLPLQALIVAPEDRAADADVERVLADARRSAWWDAHVAADPLPRPPSAGVRVTDLDGAPAPSDLDLGRGDRVSRLIWPPGGDGPGAVRVEAPPGLRVEVGEASWLDVAGHPARPLRPRPHPVWPGAAWSGGQGLPPALLVTVHTGADAPVGRHRIRLHLEGDEAAQVILQARVHRATPQPRPHGGLFVRVPAPPRLRAGEGAPATAAVLDDLLGLLRAHGLDVVQLRQAEALLPRAAATWARLGGSALAWADPLAALRAGPVDDAALAAMLAPARGAPLPVAVHLWEEDAWRAPDALALGRERAARVRRLAPELPLLATAAAPLAWDLADAVDVLAVTGRGDLLAAGVGAAGNGGARPWVYNPPPGASGPLLAWAAGAAGVLQWHADPAHLDAFDHASVADRRQHVVLAPGGRGLGTVLLADLADGLADARLLAALEAVATSPRDRTLLRAAREALLAARDAAALDGVLLPGEARAALRARVLARLARAPG